METISSLSIYEHDYGGRKMKKIKECDCNKCQDIKDELGIENAYDFLVLSQAETCYCDNCGKKINIGDTLIETETFYFCSTECQKETENYFDSFYHPTLSKKTRRLSDYKKDK